ncbi:helix-turn-helix domain-containing protein [Streptosporangium sp. NPDC051022]|uniref:helix-turn-helix domain-containing protein n=1 Tax=Streptosporangium sp. NPDC051022 TaxID=3155752 RepID=UPI003429AC66
MTIAAPDRLRLDDTQLYKVRDAMRVLNLGKTSIFKQLRTGRLRSVRQGRARLIPVTAIHDYIALLEKEAEESGK